MTRILLALFLTVAMAGCAVTDAAISTVGTAAAGNDRYTTLAAKALAGQSDLATDGIAPVSSHDLAATPASVKGLVQRLLESLHTNRYALHSVLFQLNEGPDPETLGLAPIELPQAEDDLLGDE